MDDTAKYLIHATITADGVVERSDVVGAIFGQTEGLLGDELDLRDLQQSSKVGRIDVQIASKNGQSFGEATIASSLDKVETAILAASLETITRVGPCQATVEVTEIEDVRAAKRREVVDRAKELLANSFSESVMTSEEIMEEVREAIRVENITDYRGLPAGPRVTDSDAIIVVEGRADVLRLLRFGIKNAIAVEGTNVPDAVAELSRDRTVTAFLDGDRGGELILRELAQVGNVDYVAFAPSGRSVEDLDRGEVLSALREKVPYETLAGENDIQGAVAATDGSSRPAPEEDSPYPQRESPQTTESPTTPTPDAKDGESSPTDDTDDLAAVRPEEGEADDDADHPDVTSTEAANGSPDATEDVLGDDSADSDDSTDDDSRPTTLRAQVRDVIGSESGRVRLLDQEFASLAETDAPAAFEAVESVDETPYAVILDGELPQRVLDVAAQRGVEHVVARSTGQFVKQPVNPRVRTAAQLNVD